MSGLFRAYGQVRRGSAPWRTPFLIPLGDLEPPFIQGSSNVSIDTGGSQPDLRIALVPVSLDQYPVIVVRFRAQPLTPGITDITLRLVLLMTAQSFFVDDGPLEAHAGYVVLQYRVPPGRVFPPEVDFTLHSDYDRIDPADTSPTPVHLSPPFPPASFQCDRVGIEVDGDPMEVAGGLVKGQMVQLSGVETDYNSIFNTGYGESPHSIRGIPLEYLEPSPPSTAVRPESATWLDAAVTRDPTAAPHLSIGIYTPTTCPAATDAPTATAAAGGTLRAGTYRYRSTFVSANGNESGPSPRSAPVSVGGATRAVEVTDLPQPAPAPNPDPAYTYPNKRRIYRTDCDATSPPGDPQRGDRGDDVLVAEVPLATASVLDTGPADPAAEPKLRPDYLEVRYSSPGHMSLTGTIRMLDANSDVIYGGSVVGAPRNLRVIHRPGTDSRLLWSGDDTTAHLEVDMPAMSTPWGDGLHAKVEGVPELMGLDWRILGSEFTGIGAAGDKRVRTAGSPDTASAIGRAGVRFGPTAPPASWPAGDAEVAVELADASSGTAGGLVALTGLRRGLVAMGAPAWASRDAEAGRLAVDAMFAAAAGASGVFADRTLRVARRSGPADPLPSLDLTGHFVPDRVHAELHVPAGGTPSLHLDGRVRFVRARARVVPGAGPTGAGDGVALDLSTFLDDTTDTLNADLAASVDISLKGPVRAGGTVVVHPTPVAPPGITLWPDVVVADHVKVQTGWPIHAEVSAPGVSGRVAASFGGEPPLAVRATPQVKLLQHGSAEAAPGVRAVTGRVIGVADATVPESLLHLGDTLAAPLDVSPILGFHPGRPNAALRVEVLEREHRVATPADHRAPPNARSWLRARTAHLPDRLTPAVRLSGDGLVGGVLATSEPWGAGVVWAEPSFAWSEHTDELGEDKGIGLATAGFDGLPANLELWLLDKGDALDGHVDPATRLPGVGPVGADWEAGGAVVRLDGAVALDHVQLALPGGSSRVCWNDDTSGGFGVGVILEPDHPVRHGNWSEVIAPFVKLVPSAAGLRELVLWSAGQPQAAVDPSAPEPNPCASSPADDKRHTAMGWHIDDELAVTLAVRLYDLVTPSGIPSPPPRWWSMPTNTEKWNGDEVHTGIWELQQEVQMKDYGMATVALYPKESTDNPFGDWQGGNGKWWLRQRGGLDVPLIPLFWWSIGSGDVFMGNVGGGYHLIGTNGIFSTLPKLFTWSYP